MSDREWQPDILGAGYTQHVLGLGADPDGEGDIEAVLVRREPRAGETGGVGGVGGDGAIGEDGGDARGAVLYTHGYSDYFFQTDLADYFADKGLRFYALDLRKCGRARRPGQTAHYVSDLAYYDDELDQALAIVTEENPGLPVILAAHSTGGLVVPLWLHRRRAAANDPETRANDPVAGVVLNSPWLDLQGGWMLRGPVTQLVRLQARTRPLKQIKLRPGVYGKTLHVSGTGEWEFDTDLKPLAGFPVAIGWMNAIRRAHARVHRGIETGVPVLVLRSAQSHFTGEYTPLCDRCDLVLDTRQIGRWSGRLGGQVTDMPLDGARHDVFLSLPEVRTRAYDALGTWLEELEGGRVAAIR
jgi:alpha-beta hydrolase superfamily lysophospholipase